MRTPFLSCFRAAWCVGLIALLLAGPVRLAAATVSEVEQRLKEMIDAGQSAEAVAYGEGQIKEVTPTGKIYRLITDACFTVDDDERVCRYAIKTLELIPDDEMAARMYIIACRSLRRYDAGLKVGREWTAQHPNGSDIYKDMALLAHDADRIDEATELAAEAFKRKPNHARIAGVHFYFQCVTGDAPAAATAAEAWAAQNKPDEFFWAQLGKGLSDAEKPTQALPFLNRAMQEGSEDKGVPEEIMDCYRNLGDRKSAEKFISTYGEKHDVPAALWRTMGALHYDAEAYGEALTAFQKAKKLNPENATTMANLIFTLVELKRSNEGIEEGQRWLNLELDTATPGFHRAMGHAYFGRSRWMEAEPHYREAVRMDPTRISDVRELVVVLVKLDRTSDAVAFGRQWQAAHREIADNGLEEHLANAEKALAKHDTAAPAPAS